jgi:predicted unusual protein kinase regulating ubiquinone biosynthesis (AarF/ABC1/UbiB family)
MTPETRDGQALHFDRLTLGDQRPEAVLLNATVLEYTPDLYDKRLNNLEVIYKENLQSGWQRLLEYGGVALAQVMPAAEYQRTMKQLQDPDLLIMGTAYLSLQQWCQAHAAEHPQLPILQFIAATPADLGYTVNIFQRYGRYLGRGESVKTDLGGYRRGEEIIKLRKQAKTIPPPYGARVVERLAQSDQELNAVEKASLLLADGNIPAITELLGSYRYEMGRHDRQRLDAYRKKVTVLMPLMEAAIAVRGARWQAEAPEHLRILTKHYTELQWLLANPLLGKDVQSLQEAVLLICPKDIAATTPDKRGDSRLSWPLFLHKLCFQIERLELQWQASGPDVDQLLRAYFKDTAHVDPGTVIELGSYIGNAYKLKDETNPQAAIAEAFAVDADGRGKSVTYDLRRYQYGQEHPGEDIPNDVPKLDLVERATTMAKQWFWEHRILPLRAALVAAVAEPGAAEKIQQLKPGYYRNLCLALRLETVPGTEQAVAKMKPELGDGAEVNRSVDVMNTYVKEQYFFQSSANIEWKIAWALEHELITADEVQVIRDYPHRRELHPRAFYTDELTWVERYKAEKKRYQAIADGLPNSSELFLFSDTVSATATAEAMVDPMYKPRLVAELLLPELQDLTTPIPRLRERAIELMPQPCQFRDYFLNVLAQYELWQRLEQLSSPTDLATAGIRLERRKINLRDHFVVAGKGVVDDAYMESYDSVRLVGLARLGDVLTVDAKQQVADFFTDQAEYFSPALREVYERYAVEFEIDHLRVDYETYRTAIIGATGERLPATEVAAGAEAFRRVLQHVLERFPKATHHRDSILFALMTDLATTEAQCAELERLTYRYQVNHPGDFKPDQTPTFAASETMKNYLSLFQDRKVRGEVLLWLVGGTLPNDRYIASKDFKVNEQDKVAAFWALSAEERRTIFYSALLGEGGLCDVAAFTSRPRPTEPKAAELYFFAEEFYEVVLEPAFAGQPKLQAMGKLVFIEIMTKYSAGRRVEFIVNLLDQLRELKIRDAKLRPGEGLGMVLQGLGIVGVKLGQVLSERPDLVPDAEMRADLAQLKDKRDPFNKRGVFSYARSAQLFQVRAGQPQLLEIGECIGSASIKQAHDALTTEGETVACKVERPSVARNLDEDLVVLESVAQLLQHQDYHVPEWLVPEVSQLVLDELNFAQEVTSATALREQLTRRSASITMGDQVLPIRVPKVLFARTRAEGGTQRIQMIVEEKFQGLSVADIGRLQDLTAKNGNATPPERRTLAKIQKKLQKLDPTGALAERYLHCDVDALRSDSAIDLLYQIADDGIFHADPHDGNAIVDLRPDHEQYGLIDAGSVGHAETEAMRTDFLEFTVRLMLLKQGILTDTQPIARIMHEYTGRGATEGTWQEVVDDLQRNTESTSEMFKQLVTKVLLVVTGKPDRNFRYLLKALGSSGTKFETLQNRLQTNIMGELMAGHPENIFMIPEVQKLLPLLTRIPGFDPTAFLPVQS